MSALCFLLAVALTAIAIFRAVRASRRLEAEARRIGYDLFTGDYALAFFRPRAIPSSLRPHFQNVCRSLLIVVPAVIFMLIGFWLEGFYIAR